MNYIADNREHLLIAENSPSCYTRRDNHVPTHSFTKNIDRNYYTSQEWWV